jgi:hypothetical protein
LGTLSIKGAPLLLTLYNKKEQVQGEQQVATSIDLATGESKELYPFLDSEVVLSCEGSELAPTQLGFLPALSTPPTLALQVEMRAAGRAGGNTRDTQRRLYSWTNSQKLSVQGRHDRFRQWGGLYEKVISLNERLLLPSLMVLLFFAATMGTLSIAERFLNKDFTGLKKRIAFATIPKLRQLFLFSSALVISQRPHMGLAKWLFHPDGPLPKRY